MRGSVAGVLVGLAAAGAAIVWFGHERVSKTPAETLADHDMQRTAAMSPSIRETLDQRSVKQNPASDDGAIAPTGDVPAASSSSAGVLVDKQTPSDGEIPRRSNGVRALTLADHKESTGDAQVTKAAGQKSMLQQTRISCEFATGYNNGFVWEGKLTSGSASWQGGPVIYDAIDGEAGTAQLLGEGVTGSTEGHADARVAVSANRVEFLSTLANGYVVFTTVFNERDEQGRLIAVMSRHEGSGGAAAYGSQFLGRCR